MCGSGWKRCSHQLLCFWLGRSPWPTNSLHLSRQSVMLRQAASGTKWEPRTGGRQLGIYGGNTECAFDKRQAQDATVYYQYARGQPVSRAVRWREAEVFVRLEQVRLSALVVCYLLGLPAGLVSTRYSKDMRPSLSLDQKKPNRLGPFFEKSAHPGQALFRTGRHHSRYQRRRAKVKSRAYHRTSEAGRTDEQTRDEQQRCFCPHPSLSRPC